MTASETNVPVKVVKCTCGVGDSLTLDLLRSTTLADLDVNEYNEIVSAVNKSGGIVKTVGIWRLLIAKAAEEYTRRVVKGDYVGHPFRGNQHSDSSGAGRGGAGGPRSGKPSRVRDSSAEVDALNDRLAGIGDKQLMTDGLIDIVRGDIKSGAYGIDRGLRALERANDAGVGTPKGRELLQEASDIFEDQNFHQLVQGVQNIVRAKGPAKTAPSDDPKNVGLATDYVRTQIQMIMEDDEDALKNDGAGVGNLRRAAEDGERQALMDEEMLRQAPDDGSYSAKEIKSASRRAQAKADLAEALNDTQKDFEEARKVLAATRAKADKESNPRKVGAVLSQGVRQAIGILEIRRQTLKLESEAARANDKAKRGGGTGTQYGLPLSALQDRISGLQEIDADARALNASVDEFMKDEEFELILEEQG